MSHYEGGWIRKPKQNWSIGATVKVGFLTLKIESFDTEPRKAYMPDSYILSDGKDRRYRFTPYNGLERID